MPTDKSPAPLLPTTLPVSPDFPVTWEQPEDVQLFWTFDPTLPDAMPPLAYAYVRDSLQGFNTAAAAYALPIRLETRSINSYLYQAIAPIAAPPEVVQALNTRSEAQLERAVADLADRWTSDWLPEVQAHLAHWRAVDLHGMPLPALRMHLDDTFARSRRVFEIHFLLVFPIFLAISQFEELYTELFPDDGAFEAYRLLLGFDNKTLEADRALWLLSQRARAMPEVRELLATYPPADLPATLEQSPAGRAFLAELRAYLATYGQRSNQCLLSAPTWGEDPAPVFANLQHYIDQPDREPQAEFAELAADRDRRVAAARAQLNGYPRPIVTQFEQFLAAAQTATMLSEEHAYWIDYGTMNEVRRVILECARRLVAAAVIAQPGDVFFLTPEELRENLTATPGPDLRPLVQERTAVLEHDRSLLPEPALGTEPSEPAADDPLSRALGKFVGTPPQPATDPTIIWGNAGAPGVVRGRACVVRTLAEGVRVQPGDVLVAPATLPPWTPLFATAVAIVTDAGGILSHCAIVAREYGIPAVVGTGRATTLIRDGQLVEVDGTRGVVRLDPDR